MSDEDLFDDIEKFTEKELREMDLGLVFCAGTEKKPEDCLKCKEKDCWVKIQLLRTLNKSLDMF